LYGDIEMPKKTVAAMEHESQDIHLVSEIPLLEKTAG
jgi:hypothetical protein